MRIALVHDYLNQRGGAERVFSHIARAYPDAPIYTSLLDEKVVGDLIDVRRVRTSFLQQIPGFRHRFRALAPLYPMAFERFDLSAYDLVISSTTAWAKGVHVRPDAKHICYINTVSRFVFSYQGYVGGLFGLNGSGMAGALLERAARPLVDRLTAWDYAAAQRPTTFIANSRNVAARVESFYSREALVLPCPVDVEKFHVGCGTGGYALVVSRLLPYKRVDLAIRACAQAGIPLVVIGTGPAQGALRGIARRTRTHFLGHVDDRTRAQLMAEAECVILPGEEDFGLVPIEAAAAGRPTIAFRSGGALETIIEGRTGSFFAEPTAESLAQAIRELDSTQFDPQILREYAETYAPERFRARLQTMVQTITGTTQHLSLAQ